MAWKFRAFIWGGVLLMGMLPNTISPVGIAWAQMPPQDVVVLPKQQHTERERSCKPQPALFTI